MRTTKHLRPASFWWSTVLAAFVSSCLALAAGRPVELAVQMGVAALTGAVVMQLLFACFDKGVFASRHPTSTGRG